MVSHEYCLLLCWRLPHLHLSSEESSGSSGGGLDLGGSVADGLLAPDEHSPLVPTSRCHLPVARWQKAAYWGSSASSSLRPSWRKWSLASDTFGRLKYKDTVVDFELHSSTWENASWACLKCFYILWGSPGPPSQSSCDTGEHLFLFLHFARLPTQVRIRSMGVIKIYKSRPESLMICFRGNISRSLN